MSDANKAVFLSYAREDAVAARRIADALRSQGVEVWFDQSELRGGDAWDVKLRRQIKECALFIPIVSQHSEERSEGYFRREWKLAVDRTNDMAGGRAFIVPVVIDETAEAGATVPEEFMRYQWVRLPGGAPAPEFVAQVKHLLEAPRHKPALKPELPRPPTLPPEFRQAVQARVVADLPPPAKKSAPGVVVWIALGVVFAAVGVVFFVTGRRESPEEAARRSAPPTPAAPDPKSQRQEPSRPAKADKSIAVLPFTNMSEEKDSAFFADGVHEDVLTHLAHIASLRVVSRTSVMEYRGKTENIRQIAQKLGVTYVLEGSVRRAGNKVRVTGQLIHAATDEHLWAQSYDRELTDIFALQAELAREIAKALSAALSPQERARLEHPAVANPAAYDLVLRARQIDRDGNDTRQELEQQETMLQQAVTLEPGYAAAWSALSVVHAQFCFNALDVSEARLAKARTASETARQLDPDNPEVIAGTGIYYYYGERDYPRALAEINRVVQQWPNHYIGPFMTGLIQRRQGKWVESLANLRRAAELDPGSAEQARNLMISYIAMRRYPEAIAEQERRVRLLPESLRESFEVARLKFLASGSIREGDELLAGPIADRAAPQVAVGYRKLWAAMKGDLATAIRLDREQPDAWAPGVGSGGGSAAEYAWNNAVVMAVQGDLAGARKRVEKYPAELRARLVHEPRNTVVLSQLAQIEALLGHHEAALAAVRQAQAALPYSMDALSARGPHFALAFALAWNGDKSAACAELKQLLANGGLQSIHWFRHGPWFAPLKGHPEFEALLNDPKNHAPRF